LGFIRALFWVLFSYLLIIQYNILNRFCTSGNLTGILETILETGLDRVLICLYNVADLKKGGSRNETI